MDVPIVCLFPPLHAESVWHVHGISWFSSRESISNGGNFRCGPFWSRTNTLLSFFYHSEGLRFCYNHHSVISRLHTRAHGPAWVHWASVLASSLIISRRVCSFFDFLVVFRGGLDLFLSLWPARSSCTSRTVAASTGGPTASFSTKCWSDSRRSTARMKRNSLPPSPTRTSPIRNHCPKKPKRFAKELVFILFIFCQHFFLKIS